LFICLALCCRACLSRTLRQKDARDGVHSISRVCTCRFPFILVCFFRNIKNVRLAWHDIGLPFTTRPRVTTTANEKKHYCNLFSRENEWPFITRYANCPCFIVRIATKPKMLHAARCLQNNSE
jgi:hypothetical protein